MKDQNEVIKIQAVQSPLALELASEVKRAVAPDEFVNDTLRRERGLNEIQAFMEKQKRSAAKKAEKSTAEKMLIMAMQSNVPSEAIEIMRTGVGITDTRLAELKEQAQS